MAYYIYTPFLHTTVQTLMYARRACDRRMFIKFTERLGYASGHQRKRLDTDSQRDLT